MNRKSRLSTFKATVLAIILAFVCSAQTYAGPVAANLCRVFASPADYNDKTIAVEGIISPSIHSLFLSNAACMSREGADFTTQAVLPSSWESSPNGKALRHFLHRGKSASVKLIGMFEADPRRYGPDGARFRFVITEISAVRAAPPGFHL